MRPIILFLCLLAPLSAEVREWKSEDGSRTFKGEYVGVEGENVTIRREDGETLTFPLSRLHAGDREWIERQNSPESSLPAPRKAAAFGSLAFGDTRGEVYSRLEESLLVAKGQLPDKSIFGAATYDETLQTRQQLGGLDCFIRFGWTRDGLLDEIHLKTRALPGSQYQTTLAAAWKECVDLLSNLHGKPLRTVRYPDPQKIQEGMATGTHIWNLEGGGSATVALTKEGNDFAVVVRFSSKRESTPTAPPLKGL